MFDKAEAEYRELSEKKRIVENDKDKIRKVSLAITYLCCHTLLIPVRSDEAVRDQLGLRSSSC